jgi:hypothetical protein
MTRKPLNNSPAPARQDVVAPRNSPSKVPIGTLPRRPGRICASLFPGLGRLTGAAAVAAGTWTSRAMEEQRAAFGPQRNLGEEETE